jgi:hypothetical protein
MKILITILISLVFSLVGSPQNAKEIENAMLLSEESISFENEEFSITITNVLENKYSEKQFEEGPKYLNYQGYKLAQVLKMLSQKAGSHLRIEEINENPMISFTLTCEMDKIEHVFPIALNEIALQYHMQVQQSQQEINIRYISIADEVKLESYKTIFTEMGVLKSQIESRNKVELRKYNLDDLAKWLTKTYSKEYAIKSQLANSNRYDFKFPKSINTEAIQSKLLSQYGLQAIEDKSYRKVYGIK